MEDANGKLELQQGRIAGDIFDDIESLRLDQNFTASAGVKVLTNLPVRKPRKQEFIRVNPDPAYQFATTILELDGERSVYLVLPAMQPELSEHVSPVLLVTAVTRQGDPFIWPVKLPGPDGRRNDWHTSMQEACNRAMTHWVRVAANMNAGQYNCYVAAGDLGDPEWPELAFPEMLRLAFKHRVIDSPEHPIAKQLRGL